MEMLIEIKADRKADQEKADADREQMLARMSSNVKTMQEKVDADSKPTEKS
jgi:hypothetical protein